MPLASNRIASQKRKEKLEEERIASERRDRIRNGPKHKRKDSLSLPRTAQSATRVTRDFAKKRRHAREPSEERMKKLVKEAPLNEFEAVKKNGAMGSPPRAKKKAFSDELLMSSPTPVAQEGRASKKFSPPQTRSAPVDGMALCFSPSNSDKKMHAIRDKDFDERKKSETTTVDAQETVQTTLQPSRSELETARAKTEKEKLEKVKANLQGKNPKNSNAGLLLQLDTLQSALQAEQAKNEKLSEENKTLKEALNERSNPGSALILQPSLQAGQGALEAYQAKTDSSLAFSGEDSGEDLRKINAEKSIVWYSAFFKHLMLSVRTEDEQNKFWDGFWGSHLKGHINKRQFDSICDCVCRGKPVEELPPDDECTRPQLICLAKFQST